MRRTIVFLAATLVVCSAALAEYVVWNEGRWPGSWPEELEPLREQSRTLEGSQILRLHYEIPFTSREEFEVAWPHLLKIKSEGAPVILVRGPDKRLGMPIEAGVRVYAPPRSAGKAGEGAAPKEPLPDDRPVRSRWVYTTFIELVVDGKIVDLNRIPLPADTPIVDERFQNGQHQSPQPNGG